MSALTASAWRGLRQAVASPKSGLLQFQRHAAAAAAPAAAKPAAGGKAPAAPAAAAKGGKAAAAAPAGAGGAAKAARKKKPTEEDENYVPPVGELPASVIHARRMLESQSTAEFVKFPAALEPYFSFRESNDNLPTSHFDTSIWDIRHSEYKPRDRRSDNSQEEDVERHYADAVIGTLEGRAAFQAFYEKNKDVFPKSADTVVTDKVLAKALELAEQDKFPRALETLKRCTDKSDKFTVCRVLDLYRKHLFNNIPEDQRGPVLLGERLQAMEQAFQSIGFHDVVAHRVMIHAYYQAGQRQAALDFTIAARDKKALSGADLAQSFQTLLLGELSVPSPSGANALQIMKTMSESAGAEPSTRTFNLLMRVLLADAAFGFKAMLEAFREMRFCQLSPDFETFELLSSTMKLIDPEDRHAFAASIQKELAAFKKTSGAETNLEYRLMAARLSAIISAGKSAEKTSKSSSSTNTATSTGAAAAKQAEKKEQPEKEKAVEKS